ISPEYLAVAFGTQVVIWVAIGGRGTLIGPLAAAIILGQVQNSAEKVTQDWQLIVGILLLVVVLFIPNGLMSLLPKQMRFSNLSKPKPLPGTAAEPTAPLPTDATVERTAERTSEPQPEAAQRGS
ncbi:MAG: hypothetical protein WA783_19525, partial [Phormidesmis sp.]